MTIRSESSNRTVRGIASGRGVAETTGGRDDGVVPRLGLGRTAGQRHALALDRALGDQSLEPGARQGGEGESQSLVQPQAAGFDTGVQHLASAFGFVFFGQDGFV